MHCKARAQPQEECQRRVTGQQGQRDRRAHRPDAAQQAPQRMHFARRQGAAILSIFHNPADRQVTTSRTIELAAA